MDRRIFVKQFSLTVLGTALLPMGLLAKNKYNNLWGVKIDPKMLFDEGKLDVILPSGNFDPEKNWEQTWRIWLPYRGKPGNGSGFISVKKVVGEDASVVNYSVEQAISENNKWLHHTKVDIDAKNNEQGTPIGWKSSTEYFSAPSKGRDENISSYNENSDLAVENAGDDICISFTLLDTVQRMSVKGIEQLNFTLLDEGDKLKKNHILRYKGESQINIGGQLTDVKTYEQLGEGMLPWMYYVDMSGRLLLAISGMRVLVSDTQCKQHYLDKYPALNESDNHKKSKTKRVKSNDKRPNILFVSTDQQAWNTLSVLGNKYLNTPHLDKLARKGVTFSNCYSPNPVCSPTRASWITGLATSEHGVIKNGLSIVPGLRTVGHALREQGYETVFAGKLHVGIPKSYGEKIVGFDKVLCEGIGGKGTLGDQVVSSVSAAYLQNRDRDKPFFLSVNFLQPHDICNWISRHKRHQKDNHLDTFKEKLPPLPDNFDFKLVEPVKMKVPRVTGWSELDWRYYLWSYYRMVEEVDAEIGRVLNALDDCGDTENTVIVFNSDHGEGGAHHGSVTKNYLYDEACRVPMIISYPKELKTGIIDHKTLISGLDVVPTVCDFAGAKSPANCSGKSIRTLAAKGDSNFRDYLVSEVSADKGRMVRSRDYKLIAFRGDANILFFDMKNDPGETVNLASNKKYETLINQHFNMLKEWEADLVKAPGLTSFHYQN